MVAQRRQSKEVPAMRFWANPLLRWAGSKKKLLPALVECIPASYDRYIEPFAGSACLFFAAKPKAAVLGDINAALFETYSELRRHPRLIARKVHSYPKTSKTYYRLRKIDPSRLDPIDRVARFIYLNRFCFNGVYRTNLQGKFNVPRGVRTGAVPNEATFYRCAYALRTAELRVGDFENCVSDARSGDFIYLDPPYASPSRRPTGEYGYGSFAGGDHDRLLSRLQRINATGARFLLSYADDEAFVAQLDPRWTCRRIQVRRHVAGFAYHRSKVGEILVSNYETGGREQE